MSMSDTRSVTQVFEDKKLGKRNSKKDPEVYRLSEKKQREMK